MNKEQNPICDKYSIAQVEEIIKICRKNPDYRAMVVCHSFREMAILFNDIPTEILIPTSNIYVSKSSEQITLEIGSSTIEFIKYKEGYIGRRVHALLYTPKVDYKVVKTVFVPMLIPYQMRGDI